MAFPGKLQAFLHGAEWNDVGLRTDADCKSINNGERQRKPNRESGSLVFAAFDVNCAAQGIHVAAHDIETNAATGNFRDFLGGRKTGLKDEIVNFGFRKAQAFGNEAGATSVLRDAFVVEAAAIIGEPHDNVAGVVKGFENDFAAGIFSESAAHFGGLQSVIHGVADHVHKRIVKV